MVTLDYTKFIRSYNSIVVFWIRT